MKQAVEFEDIEVDDVPISALLQVRRESRYGGVADLDDEELADPDELEKQALAEEWGPVLALPVKAGRGRVRPAFDESGGLDWGAFATVDFERTMPDFDKAKYKADKLRERLADMLIMFGIVKERLPGRAKYLVLKYLRMGAIELEHIVDPDMAALARLYMRAKRLQTEIADLQDVSRARRERRAEAWLES